jgi:two-component system response regulator FlrC
VSGNDEALSVLVVEDDLPLAEALCDTLRSSGYRPVAADSAEQALARLEQGTVSLVITDVQLDGMDGHALLRAVKQRWPELPVVVVTAYGTVGRAVAAMREGASDYLLKPFEAEALLEIAARFARCPPDCAQDPVAVDPRSRGLLELARRVAATEVTVLLSGASGTGKEVYARFLHAHSARAGKPFVAINCAAIPENMLEAVLFGYEKGAFTGAHQAHPGKFEQAQGGTLLLDEVSEMDLGLQAKLLRVLQEREVERLGSQRTIALDVRVVATSNRNLRSEVVAGRFREDLFYRLNVMPLTLAPLRQRPGDIVPLAERALARQVRPGGTPLELDPTARRALLGHDWPGNVRELENVMQRAAVLVAGRVVRASDLVFESGAAPAGDEQQPVRGLDAGLRGHERQLIVEALQAAGSRSEAAARLGISPRTLRHKLQKMRAADDDIPAPRA